MFLNCFYFCHSKQRLNFRWKVNPKVFTLPEFSSNIWIAVLLWSVSFWNATARKLSYPLCQLLAYFITSFMRIKLKTNYTVRGCTQYYFFKCLERKTFAPLSKLPTLFPNVKNQHSFNFRGQSSVILRET